MKRIANTVVAGCAALAIAGLAVATSAASSAGPLNSGGTLECSYQTDASSLALSGSCGTQSVLGANGGSLSGQIDKASKSASGELTLQTPLAEVHGEFSGSLTSGGTIVGTFKPAGSVGIPLVVVPA